MAETYTKLFSTIVASTVWGEPHSTRSVWTTLLALSDRDGIVHGSVPGLARLANATLQETEAALATFLGPDPYSRTPDNGGQRVEAVAGGWRLLNHGLYRDKMTQEQRREYKRKWDRENRRKKSDTNPTNSDSSDENPTTGRHTDSDSDTDTDTAKQRSKATDQQADQSAPVLDQLPNLNGIDKPGSPGVEGDKPDRAQRGKQKTSARFPEFWAAYPVKKGKADALKKWKLKDCDDFADQIIAHVRRMEREDDDWLRGFVPHGSTYINGERWEDEPKKDKPHGASTAAPPSPQSFGAAAAMAPSETKLDRDLNWIRNQYDRGAYGVGPDALVEMKKALAQAREKHASANLGDATKEQGNG